MAAERAIDGEQTRPLVNLPIRTVRVIRYVTPLREGGSLPAVVEADDLGTYALKFRGAGQGAKVLIAELLAGEIARAIGLPVPEIVFAELDPVLARSEPDPEIQELIRASAGLNLALDYLPGSFAFDPQDARALPPELASAIVWFDAYVTNVDRTARNTNMLLWHRKLYLIDNGAALYAQYGGPNFPARARNPFPQIRDHVLLPYASRLAEVDAELGARLTPRFIARLVATIPEVWLDDRAYASPEDQRAAYAAYLNERLRAPRAFVQEAIDARAHTALV
ncbi:MAG TPA: HipA family kinase [Thermomicrobiaceae bacterium]|nr:HipA family kinase [Thermomicrobiaceae bacterium]